MQLSIQQKVYQPWYRNNPYTAIAQELRAIQDRYSQIRITNDLRPLYAYLALADLIKLPELQSNPGARNNDEYSLGNFVFNQGSCRFGQLEPGVLYIAEVTCRKQLKEPSKLSVVKTISYEDGTPVYEFLEIPDAISN
jgi:hypothetical protein